jgi:hypothetical protein
MPASQMMEVNQILMHWRLACSNNGGGWARNSAAVRAYLADRNRSAEMGARVPEEYR